MRDKLYPFFEEIADTVKKLYSIIFLIAEIALCILRTFFVMDTRLPALIIGMLTLFLFIFCKDPGTADKHRYTKVSLVTVAIAFLNCALSCLFGLNKIWGLVFLVITLICVIALLIYISSNATARIAFNTVASKNLYKLGVVEKRNPGDVLLGYEVLPQEKWKDPEKSEGDKRKPVILPNKDRYVHTLVLGATGTGKTSQILLPMIYNDIRDKKLGVIVLEPKGDLAEKVFALAVRENRKVVYFNPVLKECPYLNPLRGKEVDVIEDLVTTFGAFDSESSAFFKTNNELLLRNAIKVVKRLYHDDATLLQIQELVTNIGGKGTEMIKAFDRLTTNDQAMMQENRNISSWFINDYFTGIKGKRESTKTYENTSGIRNQISKIVSNKYLKKVLNPPQTSALKENEYIDFDRVLRDGDVLALTSNQGALRDLSTYLGYFMILQLESAVFRRPGNEDTRRGCVVCIDEFQTYSNPSFADMLTQGRSYRVACVLATQNRGLIGMNSGSKAKSFTELVSTNARNLILFPDANIDDAKYYSAQFGETLTVKDDITYQRQRFMSNPLDDRESVKRKEEYEQRFTSTGIIYRQFSEVICSIIKNNTRQLPVQTKIEFIPRDVNDEISAFLADYKLKNEVNDNEPAPEIISPPAYTSNKDELSDYAVLGRDDIKLSFEEDKINKAQSDISSPTPKFVDATDDDDDF